MTRRKISTVGRPVHTAAIVAGLFLSGLSGSVEAKATIVTFDPPGSIETLVTGINVHDTVVGTFLTDTSHGFLRTSDGEITTIDGPRSEDTWIGGINNKGVIVGSTTKLNSSKLYCFVRSPNGKFIEFTIPINHICVATSVNKNDVVTGYGGYYGFVWKKGVLTIFNIPGSTTIPVHINDSGVVAGRYLVGSKSHGFVRAADGTITTFDIPNATQTLPTSINENGAVVGYYASQKYYSFVRDPDGTITTYYLRNHRSTFGIAINSKGVIAGYYDSYKGQPSFGFVRLPNGMVRKFQAGAMTSTNAQVINDHGSIAGYYGDSTGLHGFMRSKGR